MVSFHSLMRLSTAPECVQLTSPIVLAVVEAMLTVLTALIVLVFREWPLTGLVLPRSALTSPSAIRFAPPVAGPADDCAAPALLASVDILCWAAARADSRAS